MRKNGKYFKTLSHRQKPIYLLPEVGSWDFGKSKHFQTSFIFSATSAISFLFLIFPILRTTIVKIFEKKCFFCFLFFYLPLLLFYLFTSFSFVPSSLVLIYDALIFLPFLFLFLLSIATSLFLLFVSNATLLLPLLC